MKQQTSNNNSQAWFVVLVAGGVGSRFGSKKPKQLCLLEDKTVMEWSIDTFFSVENLEQMVIVGHRDWLQEIRQIAERNPNTNRITIVEGGARRQDSSRAGLLSLSGNSSSPVLIHDAARPWVSRQLIIRVLNATRAGQCVIPAIRSVDSVVSIENGIVTGYPDRNSIGHVQTPQGFPLNIIRESHIAVISDESKSVTDDGSVTFLSGHPLIVVEGEIENRKITTQADLGSHLKTTSLIPDI